MRNDIEVRKNKMLSGGQAGTSLVVWGLGIHFAMEGHRFHPWRGTKIPHGLSLVKQPSPKAATRESKHFYEKSCTDTITKTWCSQINHF